MNRKPIFDALRRVIGRPFTQVEVDALDDAIDLATGSLPAGLVAAPAPAIIFPTPGKWSLGPAGTAIIKKWEGCGRRRADGRFDAYPDPGSADGRPWTIGWGSTGNDIAKGTVWTQAQCDQRFDREVQKYVDQVAKAIGDAPTTQSQFDALVSFHYNTGAIATAGLTKKHVASDFAVARAEFAKWIYNDGKPMTGLKNRRASEAELYGRAS